MNSNISARWPITQQIKVTTSTHEHTNNNNTNEKKIATPTCKEQHQCTKSNTNVKKEATSHKTSKITMQDKQQHQLEKNNSTWKKHQQRKKNINTNMKKLTISHKKSGNYYLENCNLAQRLYKPNVSFMKEHVWFSKIHLLRNWNRFSWSTFIHARIWDRSSLWFWHVKVPTDSHCENRAKNQVKNHPILVLT